jgi:[NiFe] hydrogenase assembly HybE family chaperone
LTLKIHTADPAPLLEAAFRRIETERMAGVAVLNPALHVQALGFARWEGHWLGVLITPWFMNLVLVPGAEAGWRSAADGQRIFRRFAAGDYAFLGGYEPEVGEFQTCALFSPMGCFTDQESACTVALAALPLLHTVPAGAQPSMATAGEGLGEVVQKVGEGICREPMSKREFLGRVLRRR